LTVGIVRKSRRFSPLSVVGICVAAMIIAFAFGLLASDMPWGRALSSRLHGYLGNRGKATERNADLPADLDYDTVEEVYDVLRQNFEGDLDGEKLLDGLKRGLAASSGDPYTVYLNAAEAKEFGAALNNEFYGIGAEIAIKNDQLQVVAPLEGTPAEAAGLRPGDFILAIDGEDTVGLFVEQAIAKIRGPDGTEVKLTVGRAGKIHVVAIKRARIEVPNARGEILDGNVGYLKINTFGTKVVDETEAIVRDFQKRGVKSVVLDLRGNSGGILPASVEIAGLWLDNDVVLEQRGKDAEQLRSSGRGPLYGVKTVVLINKGSASASEIVAGALSDNGAAQLVGETSFGKGSVQSLEDLSGGGQLKVTIARWYTPKGRSIDHEGIAPDISVALTSDDFNKDRDPQLERALELLR
jgi:carboxyl-terminal processing protease